MTGTKYLNLFWSFVFLSFEIGVFVYLFRISCFVFGIVKVAWHEVVKSFFWFHPD